MRDLKVLKERIEYAERHLKASHTARERESDALMTMWSQIRDRFEAQETEIARYRAELAELTQANDDLAQLVDRLIGSIEGSVETSSAETVPKIATLADDLLRSEPTSEPLPPLELTEEASDSGIAESSVDEPVPSPEDRSEDKDLSFGELLGEELSDDEDLDVPPMIAPREVTEESASEGIRNLIERIEGAVSSSPISDRHDASQSEGPVDNDEELNRELEEIEALRSELNGLRNKISAGG